MPKRFEQGCRIPERALQAYLVLIGLAWNRQTITYGEISEYQMEFGHGGILSGPLGCIMGWCHEQGLPALTVLVVNDKTGIPGDGLVTVEGENFPAAQQKVFQCNWFSLFPPSISELEEAGKRALDGNLRTPSKRVEK
jgi:hypothetical protein